MSFVSEGAFGRWITYEFLWLAAGRRFDAINVGFSPVDAEIAEIAHFQPNTRQVQLYVELCRFAGFDPDRWREMDVLESGCGAGQGLNYVRHALTPRTLIGLDYSSAAVRRARARGLDVRRGRAEATPFEDGSFDCLLCVDSLGSFPSRAFLVEASRLLRPGGSMLVADYRRGGAGRTRTHLSSLAEGTALALTDFRDATPGVLRALDEDHARKAALIGWLPRFVRSALAETLSLKDSDRYRTWQRGEMTYFLAKLVRVEEKLVGGDGIEPPTLSV